METTLQKPKRERPAWWPKKLSAADWADLEDSFGGICLACGELDYEQGCEPDARGYRCSECHAMKVRGAEDARMLGAIVVEGEDA